MGFLGNLIDFVLSMVKLIKKKPAITDVVIHFLTTGVRAILDAIDFGELDTEVKLDEALQELDARTGSDIGALDIIRDLPADKEELLFDALGVIIEVLGKNKLGIPGYIVVKEVS